jgi:hypothetical protein
MQSLPALMRIIGLLKIPKFRVVSMGPRLITNDKQIRAAFHAKRLRKIAQKKDTLIIDELGLAHAKCRIDIAVINTYVHGYEIKSGKDTLERWLGQLSVYRRVLQKLTLVVDSRHVKEVLRKSPEWCGIIEAFSGPKGGIYFRTLRLARKNPETEPFMLAHLLWRSEVVSALSTFNLNVREMRGSRVKLYELLCKQVSVVDIVNFIRKSMLMRASWRDHREPGKYGD